MKSIRHQTEEIERQVLHPRAMLSAESRGRRREEPESEVRTCFQHDRDRIIHSKSFRRLKHKTQVFLAPRGDHYRTRLTHVLEVSQIARTIARALRLNEDLTEAIALGHDLGHTPFGHAGEAVLREIHPGGFDHYRQSLRVVDVLERQGRGLNLTHEVRNGIVTHSKGKGDILPVEGGGALPETLEGQVVRVSDIVAYLNHDLDDALRAGVILRGDIPPRVAEIIGAYYSERIDSMVKDLIYESLGAGEPLRLSMSQRMNEAVEILRAFLYERVYESDQNKREFLKARKIVRDLYFHYLENEEELAAIGSSEAAGQAAEGAGNQRVCDFIAGMTDSFALMTYERLFLPRQWPDY